MSYTLGTASKATGKDRATISRAIKKGRISASKNDKGQWIIDPAELHRVYPALQQDNSARNSGNATGHNNELMLEITTLKNQLDAANEREKLKDQMLEEVREDRDKWRQQATALLTDQRDRRSGGLFGWLFGRS